MMLIGNAGPTMFRRFWKERAGRDMDGWTRDTVSALARDLDATPVFPFDTPYPPIQAWARRARAGHASPLGLNIHPIYGLWHAFRAALVFPVEFDLPVPPAAPSPCDSCTAKPCLSACPVSAFTAAGYDVERCAAHVRSPAGADCFNTGCLARRACPVGQTCLYEPAQVRFHMQAFLAARTPQDP